MSATPAYAKINLSLEILGRRPDGFHELVSVMQTVSLKDELEVALGPSLAFSCSPRVLETEDNLVVRAATLLRREYGIQAGCAIELRKRIPVAAGLGGGSSDAASTLRRLNDLWRTGASWAQLSQLAAVLGSDVPFFLAGGTALVEGRGERVTQLPDAESSWFVLAKPAEGLSTARVFGSLSNADFTDGRQTRTMADDIRRGRGTRIGFNGLQAAATRICPPAAACLTALEAAAGNTAILSGSGPTSVAWFDAHDAAQRVARSMERKGFWATVVRPVSRKEIHTWCA